MLSLLRQFVRCATACILITNFAVPKSLVAETHLVAPTELQKATVAASQARQQNIETVRNFFSCAAAEKALKSAHMNPEQVKKAVSGLSDEEVAQLAARSTKAQADFVAGTLSDRDLIIIILAIAALVLIIVAVR